jgi:cell division GTPase FtsZ
MVVSGLGGAGSKMIENTAERDQKVRHWLGDSLQFKVLETVSQMLKSSVNVGK